MDNPLMIPVSAAETYAIVAKGMAKDIAALVLRRLKRSQEVVRSEYDQGHWKRVLDEKRWLRYASLRDYVGSGTEALQVSKIDNCLVRISGRDYYAYRAEMLCAVMGEYAADVPELVELGCGAGFNLLSLHLANKWPRLMGFDMSQNGVRAAQEAAAHFQVSNMLFAVMDLLGDHGTELRGKTVFTYYCLEQLKRSIAQVIDNIRRAGIRRAIHIEPTTELLELRRPLDLANYLYIARSDYLDNLLRTLRDFERAGQIKLLAQRRLYYAPSYRHDGTLVVWEPVAQC